MGGDRIRLAAAVAGLALLLVPASASAEPRPALHVELRYAANTTAPGCPSDHEFRRSVARQLSFDAFGVPPTATVTVTIADVGRRLEATIELAEGGTFTQAIEATRDECAALVGASAQAVVLAIERMREALEHAQPTAAPTPPAPAPAPPAPPKSPPRAAPSRAAPFRVDTHASAVISRGYVPAVGGGTFVGASLRHRWWMLALDVGTWWPTRIVAEGSDRAPGVGARVSVVAAAASACATRTLLFACGTAQLGDLRATGKDALGVQAARARVTVLGARVGIAVPIAEPWSVELYGGIGAPTSRVVVRAADRVLPPDGGGPSGQAPPRPFGRLAAGAGCIVALGVAFMAWQTTRPPHASAHDANLPAAVVPQPPTAPSPGAAARESAAAAADSAALPGLPAVDVRSLPSVAQPPASSPTAESKGQLGAELALTTAARSALAASDLPGAQHALDEHRQRFPLGQLAQERESLQIQALVAAGRLDEARARALEFRARYPQGLLLPSVERALSPPE